MKKLSIYTSLFVLFLLSFFLIVFLFYSQNDKKIYIGFDEFLINNTQEVFIGGNSNINFNQVPDSLLHLNFEEDSIRWTLKEPYYIILNNTNPNAIKVTPNSSFIINDSIYTIPDWVWEGTNETNFFKKKVKQFKGRTDYISLDSVFKNPDVQSLFVRTQGKRNESYQVIFLDTILQVDGKSFKDQGAFDATEGLKIQFYEPIRANTIKKGDSISTRFVSLAYKYNNYGNKHVLIKRQNPNQISCNFSQKNLAVIDYKLADSIAKAYNPHQKKIYLNFSDDLQNSNHIFLPSFSTSFNKKAFYIDYKDFSSLQLIPQGNDSVAINSHHNLLSATKVNLNHGNYNLNIQVAKDPVNSALWVIILLFFQAIGCIICLNGFSLKEIVSRKYFFHLTICVFLSLKVIVAYSLGFNSPNFVHIYFSTIASVFALQYLYYFLHIRFNLIELKNKFIFLIGNVLIMLGVLYYFGVLQFISTYSDKYLVSELKNFFESDFYTDTYFIIPFVFIGILLIQIVLPLFKLLFFGLKNLISQIIKKIKSGSFFKLFFAFTRKYKSLKILQKSKSLKILLKIVVILIFFLAAAIIPIILKTAYEPVVTSGSIILVGLIVFWIVKSYDNENKKFKWVDWKKLPSLVSFIILISFMLSALFLADDMGFIIIIFSLIISLIVFLFYLKKEITFSKINKVIFVFIAIISLALSLAGFGYLIGNSTEYDTSRTNRRISAFVDFQSNLKKGYRVTEQDNEFFAIIGKYSRFYNKKPKKELDSRMPFFHRDISEVKYPTVVNDLSTITTLVRPFGIYFTALMGFFWLMVIRKVHLDIFNNHLNLEKDFTPINFRKIIKFLAVGVLVFEGVYLFFSYISLVPFTGRLIYGLGVDSIGEHFIFIILMALINLSVEKRSETY